jgi:hypothetical protein
MFKEEPVHDNLKNVDTIHERVGEEIHIYICYGGKKTGAAFNLSFPGTTSQATAYL